MLIRRRFVALSSVVVMLAVAGCTSFEAARLYQSGTKALDRGESEVAIADLERAAAMMPEASEVQNHLGLAYASAGRDGEALLAFRRAVEIDCDNHAAAENLAFAERHESAGKQP